MLPWGTNKGLGWKRRRIFVRFEFREKGEIEGDSLITMKYSEMRLCYYSRKEIWVPYLAMVWAREEIATALNVCSCLKYACWRNTLKATVTKWKWLDGVENGWKEWKEWWEGFEGRWMLKIRVFSFFFFFHLFFSLDVLQSVISLLPPEHSFSGTREVVNQNQTMCTSSDLAVDQKSSFSSDVTYNWAIQVSLYHLQS